MLVLLCVCEGQCSKTMCFAIVAFDFFTTGPSIKIEISSLLCVCEGQFSKTMCFAIAVSDFFTTAPSINFEMLILQCVFEGHFSKSTCFFQSRTSAQPAICEFRIQSSNFARRFNDYHQKVCVWLDVFTKSINFTRRFEGHFSKSMCFFIGGTPRNPVQPRPRATGLYHIEVRTLSS